MASLLVTAAALAVASVPASAGAARDTIIEKLSQRLFPLLDAAGRDPATLDRLKAGSGISTLLRARQDRRAACGQDLVCAAQAMIWTPAEADAMGRAVATLTNFPAADDGAPAQIRREIEGVNAIVRTYGLGQVPSYPQIDGAGMIDPQERQARLQAADWLSHTPRDRSVQALDPSVDYALALLDVSDRTDAIGYEPLMGGANAAAMARTKTLDWSRYRFSAMILTGVGPEIDDMPLSPYGKYHLRLAANRFAQGDIPFIIVTGGRAHPRATRFAEAEEMRRALIERYSVPADAILIEPYARHTTTNLRNATRLLIAMGAPLDEYALIVCNPQQSAMIESVQFTKRNADELGYQPGQIGRRFSSTELAFRPNRTSARIDPRDPLDP
ncbi:YdcF family protein [Sphingobium sp. BYY-5]|uniref:YdcF family protein n=1 Tax=Sphingobium sp. BYY-5 TaxID=2926400 RepID=UPI001FA7796D|nr:YdcF family protein [Sphingobium sp. BYY-5]MCI4592159.1 YdcF family protein [Sphingobium sp. BYY-5]